MAKQYTDDDSDDIQNLLDTTKPIKVERPRSFGERSYNELSAAAAAAATAALSPRHYRNYEASSRVDHVDYVYSPGRWSGFNSPRSSIHFESNPIVADAWDLLRRSLVHFRGQPVGTIAALDHSDEKLNYDQSWEKTVDHFKLGEGVMPASFKVLHKPEKNIETLIADFGETAIGRVAPVDSGFWWIILLRAYTKSTGDSSLADLPSCQRGMRLILSLCLSEGFDTFPTLLCADGCCMIDRRMGVYGYPIEIQALFFMALRCALTLLKQDSEGKELVERIVKRLHALSYHMAVNKFNVMPDSLPSWVFDFMPSRGGYFIGNVSPAKMDFRWFCLATPEQAAAIMDLIEERWDELVGEMPLKVCYPAIEGHEWRIVTGCDPKNTRWSYHNGGSWPVLLWMLTAACIKSGRPQIARRALEVAESRLGKDHWPEYYDGKLGRFVGKQARKNQTWSIAGYLVAKMMLEDPSHLGMVSLEEDKLMKPLMKRSTSWTC
ncbi:Probable alkaline/neutral invertase B [Linum perenne]